MIWMLLPVAVLSAGFTAEDVPAYDPTDPSQVAESESGKSSDDDGLAGPAVDPDSLDPQLRRRGDMMSDTMAGLSIEAILEARCGQCHGVQKQKAGVQIVPVEALFTGPKEDWVVIQSRPGQSILMERISLPDEHDDVMPPEGSPLTTEQINTLRTWIKEGATAESAREGNDLQMQRGPRSRRSQAVRPRAWMQMYMALDLTPEQRSKAEQTARKLQSDMRNFQETHGKQMKQLQEKIRSFQDRSNPTEELLKLRTELQAIQAQQPKVEAVQESLWSALDNEQQNAMRSALEQLKRDRRGSRNQRSKDGGKQRSDVDRPMDDETRRRIRLLLEERRKAREQESGSNSGSD